MYCVIVGDIINSRNLDAGVRARVTKAANDVFDRINTDYHSSLMTNFGMVRGDAFEGVMLTQYNAPKIVQDIIKAVYRVEKTKVRISVALGELAVIGSDRNETDGPAFYTAFDRLAELKKLNSEHWLQVSFYIGPLAQLLVDGNIALLSALTESWTNKQHEIAWLMETHDGQQSVVARMLKIANSVVKKQLKAMSYHAYRKAWDGLTDYLANMDEYMGDKPVVDKTYVPYFNMAMRKIDKRDFYEASRLLQKSLEMAKNELDENDPLLISIYNNLAEAYLFIDKYDKSEEMIQKALYLQETMPKLRLQYAETILGKGRLCKVKGSRDGAQECFEEALSITQDVVHKKHPILGMIYDEIAHLHGDIPDYEKALQYYYKSLDIANENAELEPLEYAVSLNNIAVCYHEMANDSQAVIYAEKALKLYEENLPSSNEHIIEIRELISSLNSNEGGESI